MNKKSRDFSELDQRVLTNLATIITEEIEKKGRSQVAKEHPVKKCLVDCPEIVDKVIAPNLPYFTSYVWEQTEKVVFSLWFKLGKNLVKIEIIDNYMVEDQKTG